VKDSDTGVDMSGWQGRISEIDDESDLITIDWDSITLRALAPSYIETSIENGYGWTQYLLPPDEVEVTTARDTEREMKIAVEELERLYAWVGFGPEGKEIQAVLKDVKRNDLWAAMVAWEAHLHKTLTFPFDAVVSEYQEYERLQSGAKVTVRKIVEIDEHYGILVEIQCKGTIELFPLCDLAVANKKSPNQGTLQSYVVWYANRH
jgi:hypothetical protein